ncbi:MAG: response regulator [Alphaproteobacteria bacterium]
MERGLARAERDIPRGRERILLIDDEAAIARSEARLLERLGCRVEAATRSVGALEAFRAAPEEFDLVITAQAMRELSGMVLAREILKVRGDIPIILRSGFADALDALDAEEAVAAADGRAGVARYRESRADVVITDTFMPETDGLETIREIRREFLQARIIAISGGGRRSNFDYLPSALMLGARRTMDNPFSPIELLQAVAEALEETDQNSDPAQT